MTPEASPGRCRARSSKPLFGVLHQRWVRLPLASAIKTYLRPRVSGLPPEAARWALRGKAYSPGGAFAGKRSFAIRSKSSKFSTYSRAVLSLLAVTTRSPSGENSALKTSS